MSVGRVNIRDIRNAGRMDGSAKRRLGRLLPRSSFRRRARNSFHTLVDPSPLQRPLTQSGGRTSPAEDHGLVSSQRSRQVYRPAHQEQGHLHHVGGVRSTEFSLPVTGQHQWVTDGMSFLTGRNYINYHKRKLATVSSRSAAALIRLGLTDMMICSPTWVATSVFKGSKYEKNLTIACKKAYETRHGGNDGFSD